MSLAGGRREGKKADLKTGMSRPLFFEKSAPLLTADNTEAKAGHKL